MRNQAKMQIVIRIFILNILINNFNTACNLVFKYHTVIKLTLFIFSVFKV